MKKKVLSLFLALVMIFSLCTSAFAAEAESVGIIDLFSFYCSNGKTMYFNELELKETGSNTADLYIPDYLMFGATSSSLYFCTSEKVLSDVQVSYLDYSSSASKTKPEEGTQITLTKSALSSDPLELRGYACSKVFKPNVSLGEDFPVTVVYNETLKINLAGKEYTISIKPYFGVLPTGRISNIQRPVGHYSRLDYYMTAVIGQSITFQFSGYPNSKIVVDGEEKSVFSITPDFLGQIIYEITIENDDMKTALVDNIETPTFKLIVDVVENDYFPVLKNYTSSINRLTYEQYSEQTITIELAENSPRENIDYKWTMGTALADESTASYTINTNDVQKASAKNAIRCSVTNTVNGLEYTTQTGQIWVTISGFNLAAPSIVEQPASATYEKGTSATALSVKASSADSATGVGLSYQWYKNAEDNNETGIAIENATGTKHIPATDEEGTTYYYCVVTRTYTPPVEGAAPITAKTTTDCASVVITAAQLQLPGTGTPSDPYVISNSDDLIGVRDVVNGGNPLSGLCFELANDITLPSNWIPIGTLKDGYNGSTDTGTTAGRGLNILPFSGILDGNGHTITVPVGEYPLFGYVREAIVKNLSVYGEKINGYGLVNNYCIDYGADGNYSTGVPETITIENCVLKSGSSTLFSGFIGGRASGQNKIRLVNCTVEAGVVIGYSKDNSYIGSLAGQFNGEVINCSSEAQVYGANIVGGLVAYKGQAMGEFSIKNSSFAGNIEATGNYVGDIVGSGYNDGTAPNAPWVTISNCYVSAAIKGSDYIGGILGAEPTIVQCWSNGEGNISNNVFVGTICAANRENVGGIIGKAHSLNAYTVISNNYYLDAYGSNLGIGTIEIIDTDSTHEIESGAIYVNTAEALPNIDGFVYKDFNRNDDPLGEDADFLTMAVTSEQLTDGSVVLLLNNDDSSFHNWVQGENGPVLSAEPIVYKLEVSGEYKTEYFIGDALDLSGAVFTATWSDGKTETVALADITLEGFDSTVRGAQTVTAKYGAVSCTFDVTVLLQDAGEISVSFTLLGDDAHGDNGEVHTLSGEDLTVWVAKKTYTVDGNATVWDLMQTVADVTEGLSYENLSGNYVSSITYNDVTLAEFTNGGNSGWMYTLNGKYPDLGVSEQYLENGDKIVFHYTDDYTKEQGSEDWDKPASGGGSAADPDQAAADKVIAAIDAIGTVTKDSGDKIKAAREAYDKLTEAQQKLVSNYDTLLAAEKALAALNAQAMNFVDVAEGSYYAEAVAWAVANGITDGVDDTHFAPNASCTRAQVVTFLWRAAGAPEPTAAKCDFVDLDENAYYFKAVLWAVENGITDGVDATHFAPNADVTRAQVVTFQYRAAKANAEGSNSFVDVPTGAYYEDAVNWAVTNGITDGTSDTTFSPDADCVRAQIVTFLYRAAK